MKPTREDWMAYLYGELPPEEHARLGDYLETHPECAAEVEGWRATMKELDRLKAPTPRRRVIVPVEFVKWGIAAMFVLGVGLLIGRATAPAVDVATLRAEVEAAVRKDVANTLRGELQTIAAAQVQGAREEARQRVAQLEQSMKDARAEDQESVAAMMQQLERRNAADYASLRKDLETVAVTAESKLYLAQQQIGQLAGYTQTSNVRRQ
ncbi:MAG: hypothetical protein AB1705_26510 [Verrucomicrobiota bacterium]